MSFILRLCTYDAVSRSKISIVSIIKMKQTIKSPKGGRSRRRVSLSLAKSRTLTSCITFTA